MSCCNVQQLTESTQSPAPPHHRETVIPRKKLNAPDNSPTIFCTANQRLHRFRSRHQEEFGLVADNDASASSDDGRGGVGIEGGDLTPPPPLVLPAKGGGGMSAAMLSSGLEGLPSWIDPERCQHSLTRRKRKSLTEAHSYRLTEQVSNLYRAGRYKNAFKATNDRERSQRSEGKT